MQPRTKKFGKNECFEIMKFPALASLLFNIGRFYLLTLRPISYKYGRCLMYEAFMTFRAKFNKDPWTSFFKYWHEANISEVKIAHKLHSHNDLNLFKIGTVTAKNTKQWWKTLFATGLDLVTLHSTQVSNNPDSVFPAFSVPWYSGCLVQSS